MAVQTIRLVIVDDDQDVRESLEDYFEVHGLDVHGFSSGTPMRGALTTLQPDIVILDLNLPGESGFELCRWLRNQHADLGIIMLTGSTDDTDRVVGLEVGADDYVSKPFEPRELLARIRSLARRTRTNRVASAPDDQEAENKPQVYHFGDFTLDADRFELRSQDRAIEIEPRALNLLFFLCENRARAISKDELIEHVWEGRIVSDAAISTCLKSARKALGDTGQSQRFIQTIRGRGHRFVADVREAGADTQAITAKPIEAPFVASPATTQEVKFCTTRDGVGLAYAITGEGPPIVKTATWLSHIEYDWNSPIWRHQLHALMQDNSLLRYDERGNGLSDWDVPEFSFEQFLGDLETVVDAAGLDQFVLYGLSQGCAISAAYAARHPERVRGLILCGGYSRGWKRRGQHEDQEQEEVLLAMALHGWGKDNPAFRQAFTSLFIPDATLEQMNWFNELQRVSTTGENAVRIDHALGEIDITDELPHVKAPAIVIHCRDDSVVPFREGQRLARFLPGARFVALEGRSHVVLESEPIWQRYRDEIHNFLKTL